MSTSKKTVTLEVTPEQLEQLLALLPQADAPSTEVRRNAAGRLVDTNGRFVKEGEVKATPKKAPKAKKAKVVHVEVTAGNKVLRQDIARLRELGVTATGKRSVEVVKRRAKIAGITIETHPFGTLKR